ncbi:MAG: PH domain-containing protein [Betaproteobacteria bacterium]|nr:PH domain-containing protein [Betaproteobacteria bacterium]
MASYLEGALITGEKILHQGRVSWWSVWHLLAAGVLLLPVAVGIVFLAWAWIRVKATELAITDKRVIAKFGFISRNTMEISIQKVESIQVQQSLLGRMLDFGTLIISGTGTSHAPIPSISDPMAFRRAFLEAQEKATAR